MGNQHLIFTKKEHEQGNKKNSVNKTSNELENYRNFFKLITSNNDMDLDEIVDINENTQTIKGGFHGR